MALITCPDCAQQVSDQAPSCPHCGRPSVATTVEATDKRWKSLQFVAVLAMIVGLLSAWISAGGAMVWAGAAVGLAGIGLWIYARLGVWWHHR